MTDISPYVRKIRFHLHPSFRPWDVAESYDPPFQITRLGWGEFPVRVELIFSDPKNKPINIIHPLKFDYSEMTGRGLIGREIPVEIELDRGTKLTASRACKRELIKPHDDDDDDDDGMGFSINYLLSFTIFLCL